MADFYVGAADTDYSKRKGSLKFNYDANNPAHPFTLDGTNSPGQGEVRVGLGDGKWANVSDTS